mmetsp:Transcript_1281/g.2735  ORF Transcript_1281/g.2735 Transcript_1281/m.2735 type:complete len:115 (-) Transcript_1281:98-442(-)
MDEKYIPTPGAHLDNDGTSPFQRAKTFSCLITALATETIPMRPLAQASGTWIWILVFTKSSGWNKSVEHVPLQQPATNDFTTGDKSMVLLYIQFQKREVKSVLIGTVFRMLKLF